MNRFKTKRKYKETVIVYLIFLIIIIVVFPIKDKNLTYEIIFLVVFLFTLLMSINELIVDKEKLIVNYPFIPFNRSKIVLWNDLQKITVIYKETLIHLGFPDTISFILNNGNIIEKNFHLNRDEYFKLKEIAELNNVVFERKGIIPSK